MCNWHLNCYTAHYSYFTHIVQNHSLRFYICWELYLTQNFTPKLPFPFNLGDQKNRFITMMCGILTRNIQPFICATALVLYKCNVNSSSRGIRDSWEVARQVPFWLLPWAITCSSHPNSNWTNTHWHPLVWNTGEADIIPHRFWIFG